MKLSERLKALRKDRPDVLAMDIFARMAKDLETEIEGNRELISQLKALVAYVENLKEK